MNSPLPELLTLARELEAEGEPGSGEALREANAELVVLERPPGLFGRLTEPLRRVAQEHWRHVVGEIQESQELWTLVRARLADGRQLTDAERDAVRAQLLDLFRVVPAGLLAAANSALPVPGTSVFTPWMLQKLGLLPSRWREARALALLQQQHAHLVAIGQLERAKRVVDIISAVEAQAAEREQAERQSALLSHWDLNGDGTWDDTERAAYREAVEAARALALRSGPKRRWFIQLHGHVFGPVRLDDLTEVSGDDALLVCFDGRTGWVSLGDLRGC